LVIRSFFSTAISSSSFSSSLPSSSIVAPRRARPSSLSLLSMSSSARERQHLGPPRRMGRLQRKRLRGASPCPAMAASCCCGCRVAPLVGGGVGAGEEG
jgi:hypothetical protein